MSNKPCWYKRDEKWECGFFHQWSVSYEEFDTGPGQFPAAIVEDALTQECHVVFAGRVSFANDNPDLPAEKMFADGYQLPSKRGLMREANEIVNGSVYEWIKKNRVTPENEVEPQPSGRKFEPRLMWVSGFARWLVQVHPEVVEVFNNNADFLCQVKWVDGEMVYMQGGLPLAEVEGMFKESQ